MFRCRACSVRTGAKLAPKSSRQPNDRQALLQKRRCAAGRPGILFHAGSQDRARIRNHDCRLLPAHSCSTRKLVCKSRATQMEPQRPVSVRVGASAARATVGTCSCYAALRPRSATDGGFPSPAVVWVDVIASKGAGCNLSFEFTRQCADFHIGKPPVTKKTIDAQYCVRQTASMHGWLCYGWGPKKRTSKPSCQ